MSKEVISKFKENPKTKVAWWAMGLGLASVLAGPMLGTSAAVLVPLVEKWFGSSASITVGFVVMGLVLALIITALTLSLKAYFSGERSWAMWVGLVPAVMATLMLVFLILGEFLFPH